MSGCWSGSLAEIDHLHLRFPFPLLHSRSALLSAVHQPVTPSSPRPHLTSPHPISSALPHPFHQTPYSNRPKTSTSIFVPNSRFLLSVWILCLRKQLQLSPISHSLNQLCSRPPVHSPKGKRGIDCPPSSPRSLDFASETTFSDHHIPN